MSIINFHSKRLQRAASRRLGVTGGGDSPMDRAELKELAGDGEILNRAADYETVWALTGELDQQQMRAELAECDRLIAAGKPARRPRLRRSAVWATACCLLLLASGIWLTYQRLPVHYSTATGEQRVEVLDDGTRLTLNTATEVAVIYNRSRRVELYGGEAFFDVAYDPERPFIVYTPGGRAQALGTEFNVRLDGDVATVTVIEGLVAVTGTDKQATHALQLKDGESLTVLRDGTLTSAETVDTAPISYWREGKIYFNDQRLDASVAEFNRYLEHKLVIGKRELNDLRIGGVFRISDLDAFLFALEQAFDIEAMHSGDTVVLVRD